MMITFSISKFIHGINPFSRPEAELSTIEKIKEAVIAPFICTANFSKNLISSVFEDFFSKKNLINLSIMTLFSAAVFFSFGISEIIFQVLAGIVFLKAMESGVRKLLEKKALPSRNETFPIDSIIKVSFKILMGVVVFLIFGRLEPLIENEISSVLKKYFNISITEEQSVVTLMKDNSIIGLLMSLYGAVGAPIIEEYIFRGCLHNYFEVTAQEHAQEKASLKKGFIGRLYEKCFKTQKSLAEIKAGHPGSLSREKIKTILKVSLIFGVVHLSPAMAWTNVPVMLVITLMGMIMSILKETTGDLWASTTLHLVNNTVSVLKLRQMI